VTGFLHDVRGAFRWFGKTPAHFMLMIATVALGTGVNVAAFSVADATLLRPLPVAEPDKLFRIVSSNPMGAFTYPDYLELAAHGEVLASLVAISPIQPVIEDSQTGEQLFASLVTGNYFPALGVQPVLGRGFLPEEDRLPAGRPVAVISDELWKRRFGGSPEALGKTLRLDGALYTVIGVAPAGFSGVWRASKVDLWVPVTTQHLVMKGMPDRLSNWDNHWLTFVGRLVPGVTPAQAAAPLEAGVRRLMHAHGRPDDQTRVAVYSDWQAQSRLWPRTTLLQLGLVALVSVILLLSCLNVANLILARAIGRRKEIAVRLALGATRRRVMRQLLTEGLVVAALGTALGLALAAGILDLVASIRPRDLPALALEARLDRRVMALAFGAAALATVIFGLVPGLDAQQWDLASALRSRGAGPHHRRWGKGGRGVLAMAQVAMCTLLIVHTGLLARSLRKAWHLDPGFRTDHLLLASVSLEPLALGADAQRATWARLLERTRALPGVRGVAYVSDFPFNLNGWMNPVVDGIEYKEAVNRVWVGPGYFEVMGIPVLRGREFGPQDATATQDLATTIIVDQAGAEYFWPGQEAVGKELRTSFHSVRSKRVVGVVKNAAYNLGTSDQRWRLRFFQDLETLPRDSRVLYVHTEGPPEALRSTLALALQQAEPRAFLKLLTISECMGQELALLAVGRTVLGAMAALGLLLAAIGLYGLLSFEVGRRSHELGIRLAVGADPGRLGRMVVAESLLVVGIGLAVGLTAAAFTTSIGRDMLVGVSPRDPLVFLTTALLVMVTSLVAVSLPARRAARSSPLVVLRSDP
jgi:predicted permease